MLIIINHFILMEFIFRVERFKKKQQQKCLFLLNKQKNKG
jgi:hypothetical protein